MSTIAGPALDRAFAEIADGWMLVDDFDELTERIEQLGQLAANAGGIEWFSEAQRATVKLMIQVQIQRGIALGDFEDCGIPRDFKL